MAGTLRKSWEDTMPLFTDQHCEQAMRLARKSYEGGVPIALWALEFRVSGLKLSAFEVSQKTTPPPSPKKKL